MHLKNQLSHTRSEVEYGKIFICQIIFCLYLYP